MQSGHLSNRVSKKSLTTARKRTEDGIHRFFCGFFRSQLLLQGFHRSQQADLITAGPDSAGAGTGAHHPRG